MKDRRPRKLKKVLKKKFERVTAGKILLTSLVTMGSAFQTAAISGMPGLEIHEKALKIVDIVSTCANKISLIMSEKPTTWKEC